MVGYEAGGPDEDLEWEHRECFRDDQINLYLESLSNDEWPCVVAEI